MAWNPSPKVALARDLGRKTDADQVIVILISRKINTAEMITYGETAALCNNAKVLGNLAYDAVMRGIENE